MTLVEIVIASAVCYRITRFTQLDSMLEEWTRRLVNLRDAHQAEADFDDERERPRHFVVRKLLIGATCAFCVSVWVAAAIVAYVVAFTDAEWSAWTPLWWLAVATGAMVFYRYIDPPE